MAKEEKRVELKGHIERITYHNKEDGYTIARMKVEGKKEVVTVVGQMFSVTPGEVLKLIGYWNNHPKYGEQFRVTFCETILPATIKGIERYLGSGMIKGIGPIMAKRLVSKFGEATLDIIENAIEKLNEVSGIGEKRIEMIKRAWDEQKEIRDVMVFLQGHGVSPAYALKIYKQYGRDSVRVVRENPYRLAMDVYGIGFLTADKIAQRLSIPKDSIIRAEAGIIYTLHELSEDGHVCYPLEELVKVCSDRLEITEGVIQDALSNMAAEKKVVIEEDKGFVYLTKYHVAETGISIRLKTISARPKQLRLINMDDAIAWVQKWFKINLSEGQIQAIKEAINSKVMIITGGPGTGKTTIVNAIIKIYEKMGQRVILAAPTGRAAKKMTEATGHEAMTIHRLLEYAPSTGVFRKDESNPINADLIVVDETSMVDTVLMYYLLKAVPATATLILVGDVDQLPSVGPGNVLKDIIDSSMFPVVRLREIFRQSKKSMIIVNAHRINNGEMPLFRSTEETINDFHFHSLEEPEAVLERILHLTTDILPSRYGFDPMNDIQILTPMYKGVVGVSNLNTILQKRLNPMGREANRSEKVFKIGDKVMQIRNNYDKEVYNGDIGRIIDIDEELQEVIVDYSGKSATYDYDELDEIVLAYAISIHKSQGSEYPAVIIPLLTQHYILLQRNLLYTAITRGKRLVAVIGTRKALAIAIKNNKTRARYTFLKERLK